MLQKRNIVIPLHSPFQIDPKGNDPRNDRQILDDIHERIDDHVESLILETAHWHGWLRCGSLLARVIVNGFASLTSS